MNKRRLLIADNNKDLCAVLEKNFSSMAMFTSRPPSPVWNKMVQKMKLIWYNQRQYIDIMALEKGPLIYNPYSSH
jgi:hypothetical protein